MATHKNGAMHERLNRLSQVVGSVLVDAFHYLALFAIGGAIVWSAVLAFIGMAAAGRASIDATLLLFSYPGPGAMVGIYSRPTTCRCASSSTSASRRSRA